MNGAARPLFSPSVQNVAHGLLILVILAAIFKVLAPLLQPLFMAIFIYYISMPSVRWLIKRRVPAAVAYPTTLILILGVFLSFGWALGDYLEDLVVQLPALQVRFRELVNSLQNGVAGELPFLGKKLNLLARDVNLVALVDSNAQPSVISFFHFISAGLLTVFYLIFIIHEKSTLPKRLETVYGRERAKNIQEVSRRINDSIVDYMYVKFLASLITAVLAIGVMLAFGLKLPFLWGAILFFANFIPYIGSIVAFMLPLGFGLLQFSNPWIIFIMGLIFMLIDIFVGNLWEPRFTGFKLHISPLAIMLSLAFWGWLWGVVGIVLSVPIMVSIKFFLENIQITRGLAVLLGND